MPLNRDCSNECRNDESHNEKVSSISILQDREISKIDTSKIADPKDRYASLLNTTNRYRITS